MSEEHEGEALPLAQAHPDHHTAETAKPGFSLARKTIWIAGHNGMVGQALLRRLKGEACTLLTVDRRELDLTRQAEVEGFVREAKPMPSLLLPQESAVFWPICRTRSAS